jgi:hypothetical protein
MWCVPELRDRLSFILWSVAEWGVLTGWNNHSYFINMGFIPRLAPSLADSDEVVALNVSGVFSFLKCAEGFDVAIQKANVLSFAVDALLNESFNVTLRANASNFIRILLSNESQPNNMKQLVLGGALVRILDALKPEPESVLSEMLAILHYTVAFLNPSAVTSDLTQEAASRIERYYDKLLQLLNRGSWKIKKQIVSVWMGTMCGKLPSREANQKCLAFLETEIPKEKFLKMRLQYYSLGDNIAYFDKEAFAAINLHNIAKCLIRDITQPEYFTLCDDPDTLERWHLYLVPCSLFQFEEFRKEIMNDKRALTVLYEMASNKETLESRLVLRFRSVLVYSYLFASGMVTEGVPKLMADFAREVEPTIGWRLVFLKATPFNHIWTAKDQFELQLFGAWLLAHLSQTEVGKTAIMKEIPSETIERYERCEGQTIAKFMRIVHVNMKKLSGYFFNAKFDYWTSKKKQKKEDMKTHQ